MPPWDTAVRYIISIHAPSQERLKKIYLRRQSSYFNPRSLAGATARTVEQLQNENISIHAPSQERLTYISRR